MLKCQADDTVNVTHLVAEGNISSLGNVNAGNVNATESVNSQHVIAQGNISAVGNINAGDTVNSQHVIAQGNISALGNVNAGNMQVAGDIILANADCAEEFDVDKSSTGDLVPGSVMVISDGGSLRLSNSAYDKRVAGVISGAGDFRPGMILDRRSSDSSRPAVALMGKVFCRVDASYVPVEVGDLLTSSATPGHAMKATDSSRAFGAVIGKALGPLPQGKALIPILVALQ
jgi:hypothetical protein